MKKGDFLIGDGRICPPGFRRCGRTLSEFLCVKGSINCPINEFLMVTDPTETPEQVTKNPNHYYYVLDIREGAARIFYTRDNSEGLILTDNFEFAMDRLCLDRTQKTMSQGLETFDQFKRITYYEICPDEINTYLHNTQFIKCKGYPLILLLKYSEVNL